MHIGSRFMRLLLLNCFICKHRTCLLAYYSWIWPYDLMTSWLVVTWPVFFSGARVQVRREHAWERGARQGAAHLLSPVPVRGISGRKRANHAPHPWHTDPHPSFDEPGWIWGCSQAGIQPLVANLHCKTSVLKQHISKCICIHLFIQYGSCGVGVL